MAIPIEGIPAEAAELFAMLCEEPLEPAESLKRAVIDYVASFDPRSTRGRVVNPIEAMQISRICVALVDRTNDAPEDARRLVQAACRYFVLEDDALKDTRAGGLEDDAEVVSAVARHLGFESLATRS